MLINVKLFASYRELVGQEKVGLQCEPGATVGEAMQRLEQTYPVLGRQGYPPLTACNLRQVGRGHVLQEGDELAVFPPVSGG